ncbi:MAG: cytochrome d ubiquinol oxidase subunit II [Nocardioidaceae bacterium]|nr:cytochrome d ubiquinol oxidase subunit II [Nocardioidaceae bacterium]NUS51709.1 cytochrome d ubiquinol oxidase subunit II [Nocardioidaceae bacterium]
MTTVVATVLLLVLTAYVVFGGADFGAGLWDLTAGDADKGARPRAVVEHGIGPVWEANHVWLIFVFVIAWTAFPEAYASITLTLFVPLTLAALGIVLRGAGFAFRKVVVQTRYRRWFGAAFAASSVLVPYCLGAVAGGIASGRVPAGGRAGDPVDSWINPTSVVVGVLGVALVAWLAAVYLVWVARRVGDAEMVQYFRRRALVSGLLVAALLVVAAVVLSSDATYVFDGLTSRAAPLAVVGVLGLGGALTLLTLDALRGVRLLGVVTVAALVLAGGVAMWPYLLPTSLEVSAAAAPDGTLTTVLVAAAVAVVIVVPGFVLLYVLDQRDLLEEEGVADVADPV